MRSIVIRFGRLGDMLLLAQPFNKRSMRWNGPRHEAGDDNVWAAQNWIAVLRALYAENPDARILLCGTPNEAPLLEAIAADARMDNLDVAAREPPHAA